MKVLPVSKVIKYCKKGPAGKKIHLFQVELTQEGRQSMSEISGHNNGKGLHCAGRLYNYVADGHIHVKNHFFSAIKV